MEQGGLQVNPCDSRVLGDRGCSDGAGADEWSHQGGAGTAVTSDDWSHRARGLHPKRIRAARGWRRRGATGCCASRQPGDGPLSIGLRVPRTYRCPTRGDLAVADGDQLELTVSALSGVGGVGGWSRGSGCRRSSDSRYSERSRSHRPPAARHSTPGRGHVGAVSRNLSDKQTGSVRKSPEGALNRSPKPWNHGPAAGKRGRPLG